MLNIIVTLQVEGIHSWPECPIEDVSFLRHPHRHSFHITAKKPVNHDDRDLEIIMLQRQIKNFLHTKYGNGTTTCNFGRRSCEQIAIELSNVFDLSYCSVMEDGENGAEFISPTV